MDYKKLLAGAGVKGAAVDYINRKLQSRQVPLDRLNQLRSFFPRATALAGVNLDEIGEKMHALASEPETEPAPKTTKKAAKKTAVKDGD